MLQERTPHHRFQKKGRDEVQRSACPEAPSPREAGSLTRLQIPEILPKQRVHLSEVDHRLVSKMHSGSSARSARRRPDLAQIPEGWLVSLASRAAVGIRGSRQSEERAESALSR